MNNKLNELIWCYIAQFGYDVEMGKIKGLDLLTILRLKGIENEWRKNKRCGPQYSKER